MEDVPLEWGEPYQVPLSREERSVLVQGLAQWHGPAHPTEAMARAMGFSDVADLLHGAGRRLRRAVSEGEALTLRDWRRVLCATAVVFADDATGAGVDWPIVAVSDGRTIAALRALQVRVPRMAPMVGEGPHDALTDRPARFTGERRHIVAIAPAAPLDPSPGAVVPRWSGADAELVSHGIDLAAAQTAGRPLRLTLLPTTTGDHPDAIRASTAMLARRRPDVQVDVLRLVPRPGVRDLREHLSARDVVLVPDGSATAAAAPWAAHRARLALQTAWRRGVVLIGVGAGALCLHQSGLTTDVAVPPWLGSPPDDLPPELAVFTEGLGFLRHSLDLAADDPTGDRGAHYRRLVATGRLQAGSAVEAGVALHHHGEGLREAVSTRSGARAQRVHPTPGGGHVEEEVPVRRL